MAKRKTHLVIKKRYRLDTGEFSCLTVWTDYKSKDMLEIEGVSSVFKIFDDEDQYDIYIDPRYDEDEVMHDIKLALVPLDWLPADE